MDGNAAITGILESTDHAPLSCAEEIGRSASDSRHGARLPAMAMCKKVWTDAKPSGEIGTLLPWHAAGTLDGRTARRVAAALDRDPDLARDYAAIQQECAATVELNESLGTPSPRAMQKLFAAIDREPPRSAAGAEVVHLDPADEPARGAALWARQKPAPASIAKIICGALNVSGARAD